MLHREPHESRSLSERVLTTSARGRPTPSCCVHRQGHVPQPGDRMRVGRTDDPRARLQGVAHVLAAEVQTRCQPIDLQCDPVLDRHLVDALQVDGVLGATGEQPPRRVAEAADVRVAQGMADAVGHLASGHPLAAVHARLDPVEL